MINPHPAMQAFDRFLSAEGPRHLPVVTNPYPANAFG